VRALLNLQESLAVQRAVHGDERAFERLYRAHVGRVYAICLRLVADQHRAEELTQEAFVRAWEKLATYRGVAAFSSWLYRLTVNVVVESQRSVARLRFREITPARDADPEAGIVEDDVEDYGTHDSDPADKVDLERAVASLPAGARMVFVLHDIEGYQHHEIAEITQTSVGTSKAQLHRARKLLQEKLER